MKEDGNHTGGSGVAGSPMFIGTATLQSAIAVRHVRVEFHTEYHLRSILHCLRYPHDVPCTFSPEAKYVGRA